MKKLPHLSICLFLLLSFNGFASTLQNDMKTRRLYLDLLERLPSEKELLSARKSFQKKKQHDLIDQLLQSKEFQQHLARQLIRQYAPKADRQNIFQNTITEEYITEKYCGKQDDIRRFLKDSLTAKGSEYSNPLTVFYTRQETAPDIASRISERYLALPYNCARCHDHKDYDKVKQADFWGIAAYFNGMKKNFVRADRQMNRIKKLVDSAPEGSLGDDIQKIKDWIKAEESGKYIYQAHEMGDTMGMMAQKRAKKQSKENRQFLLAPQMVIWEKEYPIEKVRINYRHDGKVKTSYAKIPLSEGGESTTARPRDVFAHWVVSDSNPYTAKATVNWVSRWLLGHAFVEPVSDIFDPSMSYKNKTLDWYSTYLKKQNYSLSALIRKIITSRYYMLENSSKKNDEQFLRFKIRKQRYLTGEQVLNSLSKDQSFQKNYRNEKQAMRKKKKEKQTLQETFPVALSDSEAYYKGSVSRSLFFANNSNILSYINSKSRAAHKRVRQNRKYREKDYILHLYRSLLSRDPTSTELSYLTSKLRNTESFAKSGYFEVTWSIINSPEMRLY